MIDNRGDECAELRQLNRQTFLAEERRRIGDMSWREFLERSLGEDFLIRRARADLGNQNREQMLDWIEEHPSVERTVKEDEVVAWCSDTLGVVISPLEMLRDGAVHRYQNVKVFTRSPRAAWQCVYWQVTEMPLPQQVTA
jgi:hypothetical protein